MKPSYKEARSAQFVALDFETTGSVPGYPVEPWQVGIVRVEKGGVCRESLFESLMRVGERPFNPRAPGRHAQIRAQLAVAPTTDELLDVFSGWLTGVPLVAHNVGTERAMLAKIAPLHRFGPWVDTLALARHAYPKLESKSLEDVTAALGLVPQIQEICPDREPHDALYDATACAALFTHFLSLPGWEHVTVEALTEA
jgi:DNA polymerase-3 subunit epsilon